MTGQLFVLPDLGEGLREAELVRWHVKVGDPVAVDAPIAEVETAKATVEIPSPYGGVVARLHAAEGAVVEVGAPLISVASDTVPDYLPDPAATDIPHEIPDETPDERPGNVLVGYGPAAAPRLNRSRAASPVVRRLAKSLGLDLAAIDGTGPDGLVTRADVERAAAGSTVEPTKPGTVAAASGQSTTDKRTGLPIGGRVRLHGTRKAVADAMARSRREIPEATIWVDVDVTALRELRTQLRDIGLLALVARFTVAGLVRFPDLNARVDTEAGEIVRFDGVNLGLATQTDRGLVVPAVAAAHAMTTRALDAEIRRLTEAARDGSATPAELTRGSFTLNNYGRFGVDGSAAVINHPEVAILGFGRIVPRPWVAGNAIVPRDVAQLSLVFDHRVCDGETAAGFLRFVADAMEAPATVLADL